MSHMKFLQMISIENEKRKKKPKNRNVRINCELDAWIKVFTRKIVQLARDVSKFCFFYFFFFNFILQLNGLNSYHLYVHFVANAKLII